MRESSLVPTNVLNWPAIEDRLPEEKLIFLALWSAPFLSCIGVGELPVRPFSASLGLPPESVKAGINNLVAVGVLHFDELTGEIFIDRWFSFHKFNNPKAKGMATASIKKVQSERLKNVIAEKSKTCFPTATPTSTLYTTASTTTTTTTPEKQQVVVEESEINKIIESAIWQAEQTNGIQNKPMFINSIRNRLEKSGIGEADLITLSRFNDRFNLPKPKPAQGRGGKLTEGKWGGFQKKNYDEGINEDGSF